MGQPSVFRAQLVRARPLTPLVRELTFACGQDSPLTFEAGQWVQALVPPDASEASNASPGTVLKRAYSIASPPNAHGEFVLAVTRVPGGPVSNFLHALPVGDHLEFQGPQGFFTRRQPAGTPSLWVATGTGLSPLRSMLLHEESLQTASHHGVLLGVRYEEDILYRDEFEQLAACHPSRIRFDVTLSQGSPHWLGLRGYVQAHVQACWEALRDTTGQEPHVYICGLAKMVSAVRDVLRKQMQLPRELVHSERYD